MQLPIVSYGHRILRQKCIAIDQEFANIGALIDNMWETLKGAKGCGLAAPQVDLPVRLFIVDSKTTYENSSQEEREYFFPGDEGIQETFINAAIVERSETKWTDVEGCLSIPGLAEEVLRSWQITIEYFDRDFQKKTQTFSGSTARMIQHEFDHIEGILYLDYLTPLKRKVLSGRLKKISEGNVNVNYPMKFIN